MYCTVQMRLTASERRSAIERAATDLFAQNGYTATTLDQIAARAGVTKPMLYRHFESKQELFMTLLERHRDQLAAAPLDALLSTKGSPFEDRLTAMLEAWFAHADENPFVLLLLHDTSGDPRVNQLVEELHDRQRAADIALIREFAPHVPERELDALGEIIRSALSGLAQRSAQHPEADRASTIAALHRIILGLGVTNSETL